MTDITDLVARLRASDLRIRHDAADRIEALQARVAQAEARIAALIANANHDYERAEAALAAEQTAHERMRWQGDRFRAYLEALGFEPIQDITTGLYESIWPPTKETIFTEPHYLKGWTEKRLKERDDAREALARADALVRACQLDLHDAHTVISEAWPTRPIVEALMMRLTIIAAYLRDREGGAA